MKQAEYSGGEDSPPQARRGMVWAVLPSQLRLKIGFSLEQRWKYLARSSYSVFVA